MKFIVVTNDTLSVEDLVNRLIGIAPYIDHVIVREKRKSRDQLKQLYNRLLSEGFPMEKCIVHNDSELALRFNIPFVQLPSSNDQLENEIEKYPGTKYGKSIHTCQEAQDAQLQGAAYVLYGHIFQTKCKEGIQPRGIERVSHLLQEVEIPVYVIGGILPKHLVLLKKMGVNGVAVMSTIFEHKDPVSVAREYDEIIHDRRDL